jgi:hypothetical protein
MTPVDLADEIYNSDLDCPLDTSIPTIVFKLLTLVGSLNANLDLCFTVTETELFDPELTTDQAAVLRQLYLVKYYGKKIRDNLGAGGVQWTEIREADSVIKRTAKTDVAKNYLQLKRDAEEELRRLVGLYRINYAITLGTEYTE